jgi:hypothetical protein
MPKLKELENQTVMLLLHEPNVRSGIDNVLVKLLNVDDGGIWIEDQGLANQTLADLDLPAMPAVIAIFYPLSLFFDSRNFFCNSWSDALGKSIWSMN